MRKIVLTTAMFTLAVQTTSAAGQEEERAPHAPAEPQIEAGTPVFDPDREPSCEDDPTLVQGVEGEARLQRDPARPDSLRPMHAVDYAVDGCSLLVMADGTMVRPDTEDEPIRLMPAQ